MAKPNRINLRTFQQELSERLKHKTAAQVDSLRLALECNDVSWLVRTTPAKSLRCEPVPIPLTKPVPGRREHPGQLVQDGRFRHLHTGAPTARRRHRSCWARGFSEMRSGAGGEQRSWD
jgi:hypothetical protein